MYEEFQGKYVKVVYGDQGHERVIYGTFEEVDEFMIKLRFNTGIPTTVARSRIIRITLKNENRKM